MENFEAAQYKEEINSILEGQVRGLDIDRIQKIYRHPVNEIEILQRLRESEDRISMGRKRIDRLLTGRENFMTDDEKELLARYLVDAIIYEKEGDLYEGHKRPDQFSVKKIEELFHRFNITESAPLNLLDLGAGDGFSLSQIKDRFGRKVETTAVSEREYKHSDKIDNYHIGPAEILPNQWEGKFHYIQSTAAFWYFLFPEKAFREVCRCLRSGGEAELDIFRSGGDVRPNIEMTIWLYKKYGLDVLDKKQLDLNSKTSNYQDMHPYYRPGGGTDRSYFEVIIDKPLFDLLGDTKELSSLGIEIKQLGYQTDLQGKRNLAEPNRITIMKK